MLRIALLSVVLVCVTGQDVSPAPVKKVCNEGLGECVPFDRCSNATQFSDGTGIFHVRFGEEEEVQHCHYLEFCCDPENVIDVSSKIDLETDSGELEKGATDAPVLVPDTVQPLITADIKIEEASFATEVPLAVDSFKNPIGNSCSDECVVQNKIDEVFTVQPTRANTCDDELNECIPFYLCLNTTYTDGAEVLNSRFDISCPRDQEICCSKEDNLKTKVPTSCGLRNKKGVGFEIENTVDEAQFGEFPWMAAIGEFSGSFKYTCGGSLIHPQVVMTGAHCVHEKNIGDLRVLLGEWDTQTTLEILPHSEHEVSQVISHPEFGSTNLFNNIALLVLSTPVKLSAHINTICLPPATERFDNEVCFASGWGQEKFGQSGAYRVNLKKVELPVVPLKQCQDSLRTTQLGARFKLNTSFMCAGGEKDVDTCTGDGGSPLVCGLPGKAGYYYQAGIVSWGIECGKEGVPGVYTSVAKFREFIDMEMNSLGYGTSSYAA